MSFRLGHVLLLFVVMPLFATPATAGECHALIVGGQPGSGVFARRYRDWATRFHSYLVKSAGVPPQNVVVLSGDPQFKAPFVRGEATAAGIVAALKTFSARVDADDQFILVLFGHGTNLEDEYRLQLPGSDLSPAALAAALKPIRARNQVYLNFSGAAGGFLSALAGRGRVNVTANAEGENSEPVFAEFFLRALEGNAADGHGAPKDGRVSVLEAYNHAVYNLAQWVGRQKVVMAADGSRSWTVEGRQSVALFKKLYAGGKDEIGARVLAANSRPQIADPQVIMRVPTGPETKAPGFDKRYWEGRRTVVEHAMLEDCGDEEGVYGLVPAADGKNYLPLDGRTPGEPGYLAVRVVLGKTELLPAPPVKKKTAGE